MVPASGMTYYTDHSIIIAHPEPGGEWTLYPEVIEGDKRLLHAGQPARPFLGIGREERAAIKDVTKHEFEHVFRV